MNRREPRFSQMTLLSYHDFVADFPNIVQHLCKGEPIDDSQTAIIAHFIWKHLLSSTTDSDHPEMTHFMFVLEQLFIVNHFPYDSLKFCMEAFLKVVPDCKTRAENTFKMLESLTNSGLNMSDYFGIRTSIPSDNILISESDIQNCITEGLESSESQCSLIALESLHFFNLRMTVKSVLGEFSDVHHIKKIDDDLLDLKPWPKIFSVISTCLSSLDDLQQLLRLKDRNVLIIILTNPFHWIRLDTIALLFSEIKSIGNYSYFPVVPINFLNLDGFHRTLPARIKGDRLYHRLCSIRSKHWNSDGVFYFVWDHVSGILQKSNTLLEFEDFPFERKSNIPALFGLPICCYHIDLFVSIPDSGYANNSHNQKDRVHEEINPQGDASISWNVVFSKAMAFLLYRILYKIENKDWEPILLTGSPGSGKTIAIATIVTLLKSIPLSQFRVIYLPNCCQWKSDKNPHEFLFDELLFALHQDGWCKDLESVGNYLCSKDKQISVLFSALSSWYLKTGIKILFFFDQINALDNSFSEFPFKILSQDSTYPGIIFVCSTSSNLRDISIEDGPFQSVYLDNWLSMEELRSIVVYNSSIDANDDRLKTQELRLGIQASVACSFLKDSNEDFDWAFGEANSWTHELLQFNHYHYLKTLKPKAYQNFINILSMMFAYQPVDKKVISCSILKHKLINCQMLHLVHGPDLSSLEVYFNAYPEAAKKLERADSYEAKAIFAETGHDCNNLYIFPVMREIWDFLLEHHKKDLSADYEGKFEEALKESINLPTVKGFLIEKFIIDQCIIDSLFSLHCLNVAIDKEKSRKIPRATDLYIQLSTICLGFNKNLPYSRALDFSKSGVMFRPLLSNHPGIDLFIYDLRYLTLYCIQISNSLNCSGHFKDCLGYLTQETKDRWTAYLMPISAKYRIRSSVFFEENLCPCSKTHEIFKPTCTGQIKFSFLYVGPDQVKAIKLLESKVGLWDNLLVAPFSDNNITYSFLKYAHQ